MIGEKSEIRRMMVYWGCKGITNNKCVFVEERVETTTAGQVDIDSLARGQGREKVGRNPTIHRTENMKGK
jgi:hypothetical protein